MDVEPSQQPDRSIGHLATTLAAAISPWCIADDPDQEMLDSTLADLLACWTETPGDLRATETLGRRLVEAGCVSAAPLRLALPILGDHLRRQLPGATDGELFQLLGALATGFTSTLQEKTLHHQEQLHQALRESRDAARAALEEETRFVNAILDHIEALVIVATADGTIIRFNRTAERLTGYTLDEVASGLGLPLITDETRPAIFDAVARLQSGPGAPRALPVRTALRLRSGETRQVDWMITLLYDDSGQFTHYVASGIDVSGQLQVENELRDVRRLLDERESRTQRSLARSLHDGPVQELLSLSHTVAEMQTRAEADQLWTARQRLEELIPALEILRRKLVSIATGLRLLIAEMRPPGLEEMGLRQALEALLHQYREGTETPWPEVTLQVAEEVALLQEPARTTLYYLIREALRNVQRHAQAKSAAVVVRVEEDRVHLLVRDDGWGFIVPDRLTRLVHYHKYGLVGMEERVRLRGGELEIDSEPGLGTTIRASFPIEQVRRAP